MKYSKKSSHHHGDLRAALIDAGVKLVAQDGPDALSIRKVAVIAGVSHAAPAHHFPTLVHLRTAIVAYGHDLFAKTMRAEMAAETIKTPRANLLAAGRGYIKFAINNSALYHLMFGGARIHHENADFQHAAFLSTSVLEEISAPIIPSNAGVQGNQLLVWSIIHGFAGILLSDNTAKIDKASAPELLEEIFPHLPMVE